MLYRRMRSISPGTKTVHARTIETLITDDEDIVGIQQAGILDFSLEG
jgi:hypothetical protein